MHHLRGYAVRQLAANVRMVWFPVRWQLSLLQTQSTYTSEVSAFDAPECVCRVYRKHVTEEPRNV
eukprot:7835743-Pyramimonas_sp.AAC.1